MNQSTEKNYPGSEECFRHSFDDAEIGMALVDLDGRWLRVNPTLLQIVGYSEGELLGSPFEQMTHPEDLASSVDHRQAFLANEGSGPQLEKRYLHRDGHVIWVRTTLSLIWNAEGQPRLLLAQIEDVTAARQMKEVVKNLQQQLVEQKTILKNETACALTASNLKSKFLTHMSHELRSPLHGIIGFSELLYDQKPGPLNAQQLDFLGDVLQSSRHLLRLIDDLLDLSKIEAGRLWLNPEHFSLREVIASVSGALQPLILSKNISCSAEIWLESDTVYLDRQKISQILYNLLSNAIKFTPESGSILLRVLERDGLIELAVHDTGIGIKPEDIGRLFTEFEQLETEPHYRHQGTGLGLMLTRKLALLHGGNIRVESVHGHSTTLIVSLPHSLSTNKQP